jgi:hypothetical protein
MFDFHDLIDLGSKAGREGENFLASTLYSLAIRSTHMGVST